MARVIVTIQDWDAYMDEAQAEFRRAIAQGLELALDEGVQIMRADAPVKTGNFQAGIGVPGTVAASKTPIPGLAERKNLQVTTSETQVSGVINFAMEYSQHVIDRKHPEAAGMQELERLVPLRINEALTAAGARLA